MINSEDNTTTSSNKLENIKKIITEQIKTTLSTETRLPISNFNLLSITTPDFNDKIEYDIEFSNKPFLRIIIENISQNEMTDHSNGLIESNGVDTSTEIDNSNNDSNESVDETDEMIGGQLNITNLHQRESATFDVTKPIKLVLFIKQTLDISIDNILKACENLSKIIQSEYVETIDETKIELCNGIVVVSYPILSCLATGESWYNKQGYTSSTYKRDLSKNKELLDKPLSFLLGKLFGSMQLTSSNGMIRTLTDNMSVFDEDITFNVDMPVGMFFSFFLDYLDHLYDDPVRLDELCNQLEKSKKLISLFNEVNKICIQLDNLGTTYTKTQTPLLLYNPVLLKKINLSDNTIDINNSDLETNYNSQLNPPTVDPVVKQPLPTPVVEQPAPAVVSEPVVEQPASAVVSEPVVEQPAPTTVESVNEKKTEEKTSNKPIIPGVIEGGTNHPHANMILKPFNGGGNKRTLRRKHKTYKSNNKYKNKSRNKKYKNKSVKHKK
jgi:hypothetical protein